MNNNILVFADDKEISAFLTRVLGGDYTVTVVRDEEGEIDKLSKASFDLIFYCISEGTSIDTLKKLKMTSSFVPVIVISRLSEPSLVVKAVKNGAFDFVLYPCTAEKIRLAVNNALEHQAFRDEIDYLRRKQDIIYKFDEIIAESPAMKSVIEVLKKFSKVDSTILMTGETGTGKSFLSGAIHFNSDRRKRPFVKINCANIPELLLESELFGHERGAFTGATKTRVGRLEQARGGTVFLDEIGELPLSIQAKLLRFLEEKKFERIGSNTTITVDVRIIAATNRDLEKMVKRGEFREDLYYRLNILRVEIPPLRNRIECIEPLSYYFLKVKCVQLRKRITDFEAGIIDMFRAYHWPGNVRQLANVIERAVILEEGTIVHRENIFLPEFEQLSAVVQGYSSEKDRIIEALKKSHWVQKKAAELLGLSPRMLNYKIRKYGITYPGWRKYKG